MIRRALSALRRAWRLLRGWAIRTYVPLAYPGVRFARGVSFGRDVRIRAFDGGRITIAQGTHIGDHALITAERGAIEIGKGCLIGRGNVIVAVDSVSIGDGTLLAEYVTIRDQDHRTEGAGSLESRGSIAAAVTIGCNVWLGAKVTVTRGVAIGDEAVVGANAVVTRSLSGAGRFGGVPARALP